MEELGIVQVLKKNTIQATMNGNNSVVKPDVVFNYNFAAGIVDYLEGKSESLPDFSKFAYLFNAVNRDLKYGVIVSMGKGLVVRSDFSLEMEYPIDTDFGRIDSITSSSCNRYLIRYKDFTPKSYDSYEKYLHEEFYDTKSFVNIQKYLAECEEYLHNLSVSKSRNGAK